MKKILIGTFLLLLLFAEGKVGAENKMLREFLPENALSVTNNTDDILYVEAGNLSVTIPANSTKIFYGYQSSNPNTVWIGSNTVEDFEYVDYFGNTGSTTTGSAAFQTQGSAYYSLTVTPVAY